MRRNGVVLGHVETPALGGRRIRSAVYPCLAPLAVSEWEERPLSFDVPSAVGSALARRDRFQLLRRP